MNRNRFSFLSSILCVAIAVTGCTSSEAPVSSGAGTIEPTQVATGRYVQTDITPSIEMDYTPTALLRVEDETILSLYCDEMNAAAAFLWNNDSWVSVDAEGAQAFLDQLDPSQFDNIQAFYSGNASWWIAATATDGTFTLYQITETGVQPVALENIPSLDPQYKPFVTDFSATPEYAIFSIISNNQECVVLSVNKASGTVQAVIEPSVPSFSIAVADQALYLRNRVSGTIDAYSLSSGEKVSSNSVVEDVQDANAYTVDPAGNVSFLTMEGIFRADFASAVKQTMVNEKGFVYAVPQTNTYKLLADGDASYLVACMQNDKLCVVRIAIDSTLPTQTEQVLSVWALEDNDVIRSAAAVFSNQYPDCEIQLEFGRDSTSQGISDEDIIKNLNTRLLAGEAPDVLFLDGLPIQSLMEKGVLAPLQDIIPKENVYENVMEAYTLNGTTYAYPSVFHIPIFVSATSDISAASMASLEDFASLYQNQELIFNTSYEDIFDSFYTAFSSSIFTDEKSLDEEKLRNFLFCTKEMIDGQKITTQKNEYAMASGDGQSVSQSEFAMSLIKVSEGKNPCGTGMVNSQADALMLFRSYPSISLSLLPGSGFEPEQIVSIPVNASNPEMAKAFITIMLTDDCVQLNTLYPGFSVIRGKEKAYVAERLSSQGQEYTSDPRLFDWDALIESLGAPSVNSVTIYTAVHDTAFSYYDGEINLDTAVQTIAADLQLYFAEYS